MKIETIHLKNFRCFKSYDIEFGKKITVFIGKNGTGKTNLIHAMKKGLSFMFSKSQNHKKTLSQSNNCNVRAFNLWDSRYDEMERAFCFPVEIDFTGKFKGQTIEWSFYKKQDPGSLYLTKYRDALNIILDQYNKNSNTFEEIPVLAYFSDSYPHVMSNLGVKSSKIAKMDILPRDFGYYGWDEDTSCAELWQRRFIKVSNSIKDIKDIQDEVLNTEDQIELLDALIYNKDEFDRHQVPEWESKKEYLSEKLVRLKKQVDSKFKYNEFVKEREFIENKIIQFTAPLRQEMNFINSEFQVNGISVNRPDRESFSIEFSFNKKSMHFEILPQGYKRLFSMVFDIAYRGYIINPGKEPNGIVIIDEIELHLHPSLQQEVIGRFQKAFPEIQFIVSSHSPLVISNLKADGVDNKIIKLENTGTDYTKENVENIFGIDYTTNLIEVMESDYRSSTIDKLINAYLVLFGKKKEAEAELILQKLKDYLGGDIPTLLQKEIDNQKKAYL
jgi:predicted ATP-binding protein involved in virulence